MWIWWYIIRSEELLTLDSMIYYEIFYLKFCSGSQFPHFMQEIRRNVSFNIYITVWKWSLFWDIWKMFMYIYIVQLPSLGSKTQIKILELYWGRPFLQAIHPWWWRKIHFILCFEVDSNSTWYKYRGGRKNCQILSKSEINV